MRWDLNCSLRDPSLVEAYGAHKLCRMTPEPPHERSHSLCTWVESAVGMLKWLHLPTATATHLKLPPLPSMEPLPQLQDQHDHSYCYAIGTPHPQPLKQALTNNQAPYPGSPKRGTTLSSEFNCSKYIRRATDRTLRARIWRKPPAALMEFRREKYWFLYIPIFYFSLTVLSL
jgi:hypothetical protein